MSRPMTKPTKWPLCPVKTRISLGIYPVLSESSLSTWRNIGPSATHWAHCEDWSDWADTQADLSLCWEHRSFCWFCHETSHILLKWHHNILQASGNKHSKQGWNIRKYKLFQNFQKHLQNLALGQKKIICVFQVSRPNLGFYPDRKHFIVNCEQNSVK